MQLSNIKKSFGAQQQTAHTTNDDELCLSKTTTSLPPGNDQSNSIMSMTNILLSSRGREHLSIPQRPRSVTNLHQPSFKATKNNNRLRFNVCGETFEVLESTVQRYPNTLLADAARREKFWDAELEEYYLDRNRACFESVLTYYQSNGILIRPQNIPDVLFVRELQFYDLGEDVLQKVRGNCFFVLSKLLCRSSSYRTDKNRQFR